MGSLVQTIEHATTVGRYAFSRNTETGQGVYEVDDPILPNGLGWVLCGSAAADGALFWFWRRPLVKPLSDSQ